MKVTPQSAAATYDGSGLRRVSPDPKAVRSETGLGNFKTGIAKIPIAQHALPACSSGANYRFSARMTPSKHVDRSFCHQIAIASVYLTLGSLPNQHGDLMTLRDSPRLLEVQ